MKTKTIFLTIALLVIQLTNLQHVLNAMPVIDIANPGSLTGRVSDFSTKQPIEYVTVVLFSAKDSSMVAGTISGKEGNFSLSMLDSGKYYVEISFIGFEKKQIDPVVITSRSNKINLGEITLAPFTANINKRSLKRTTTSDKRIATECQELTRNNPLTAVNFNTSH